MFCVWCFYFTSARVEAAADQYDRQLRWGTGAGQWILEAPTADTGPGAVA
jgi:hypothetical protein